MANGKTTGILHLFSTISILGVCCCCLLSGCAETETWDSSEESDWTSLFNGEDLSGWTIKCKPKDRDKDFWRVDDGTILADSMGVEGHDYVWLVSDHEYSDFILRLKFQAYRGSPGNSGVQIRSRYDDTAGWLDGPQIDINPPGPWRTGMIWDETRGNQRWLYPPIPKGEWVDPSMAQSNLIFYYSDEGERWNDLEISAIGMQLRAVLNGVQVMHFNGDGVLNDTAHKRRNVGEVGRIALQIHKGDQLRIRFRDIFIRDLSDEGH